VQRSGLSAVSREVFLCTVSEILTIVVRGSPRVPVATGTRGARSEITGFMLHAACRVLAEELTRVSGASACQRWRVVPGARLVDRRERLW
jgi:hypothetical protein